MTNLSFIAVLTLALSPATLAAEPHDSMTLDWLAGCWQSPDGSTIENWTAAGDGFLFGYSVTMKDEKIVFFEHTRIDSVGGEPVYYAYPRGTGPTSFSLHGHNGQGVTFVNADHDYPQSITYRRDGDKLTAKISLADGTKQRLWKFIACKN